jgi:hypothetical protein
MELKEAEVTELLLNSNAPSDTIEVLDGFNAATIYAQEETGNWLPALTMRVNTDDISGVNWRRPLRLAVRGEKCNFPEL